MSFDNLCIGKDYFSLQCLLPGVIALWIVLAFVEPKVACLLVHEDGIVQWLQVLFLLLTVLYCMLIVRSFGCNYDSKIIRNTFFLFLVLAILVMFEEISWGQRLLGIETPACISKVNVQNQITLHNLIGFQRVRHWLLIFFGLVGILLTHIDWQQKKRKRFSFIVPDSDLIVAFYFVLLSGLLLEISFIAKSLTNSPLVISFRFWTGRFSELGEFAVTIIAYTYTKIKYNQICSDKLKISSDSKI